MCIYIYIYIYIYLYIYIYMYLSLSIYIYIYTHTIYADTQMGIHQRGVQSEGDAVDGGSIIQSTTNL